MIRLNTTSLFVQRAFARPILLPFALCLAAGTLSFASAAAAAPLPQGAPGAGVLTTDPAARELERLRRGLERREAEQQAARTPDGAPELPAPAAAAPEAPGLSFMLKDITHNPSAVLSDAEIREAVAPYIGKTLDVGALKAMLGAINSLYQRRGYVVCEARILPQRIRDGVLALTLIEGRTEALDITGNSSTNSRFIAAAFDLEEGEVANYREMSEDLVHWNMTSDVVLSIDIRAGNAPGTTRYTIRAVEPERFALNVFADSLGPETTGRLRAGASITDRSVFGLRDSLMVLGLASRGAKSGLVSYSLPLSARGTRLTLSASRGEVKVKSGPSAEMDVTGESNYLSARLETPLYVSAKQKWTGYVSAMNQHSETSMFDVEMNATRIKTLTAGLEGLVYGEGSVYYLNAALNRQRAVEEIFINDWQSYTFTGSAFAKWRFNPTDALSVSAAWQKRLGGDSLTSAQQFYLGTGSGVRGYPNDLIAADSGAWVNLEVERDPGRPYPVPFAFIDAGRLSGDSVYSTRSLASAGFGIRVPLWQGAQLSGWAAMPLVKNVPAGAEVSDIRFDVSFTALW